MLLASFIRQATESLGVLYPAAEARSVVMLLCESVLGTKSYTHIIEPQTIIAPDKETILSGSMRRLLSGEPIQYVLEFTEFCGRRFKVCPSVLIPRPETEQLCAQALKFLSMLSRARIPYRDNAAPIRVLDLCTGSGCIAWTLALGVPGCVTVGVDISSEALDVARSQDFTSELKALGAKTPAFVQADILEPDAVILKGPFDLIISNPPYIMESEKAAMRANVLDFEPGLALFVPDENPLIFYKSIAELGKRLLSKDGVLMLEINELMGSQSESLLREEGFSSVELKKDFAAKFRFLVCQNRP